MEYLLLIPFSLLKADIKLIILFSCHILYVFSIIDESTQVKCNNTQIDMRYELNVYSFLSKSIFNTLDTYANHQYIVIAYKQYERW